jgi:lipopolysaccharide export system permease protein
VLCFLFPVLLYFPLLMAGTALGRSGRLAPWLAMWDGNLVVGGVGLVLLFLAFRR